MKRLTQVRLSRLEALRGVAAGALAGLTGAALPETESAAKRHHKGKASKGKQKVTICHCPPDNPSQCHTITIGRSAAQKHLRQHPGDALGPCGSQTTTTTAPTTTTARPTTTTTAAGTTTTAAGTTTTVVPACPSGQCQGGSNPVNCATVSGCMCLGSGANSVCGR